MKTSARRSAMLGVVTLRHVWSACLGTVAALVCATAAAAQPVTYLAPGEVVTPPTRQPTTAPDGRPDHDRVEFPLDGPCRWLPLSLPTRNEPGRAQRTEAELREQFRLLERLRDFLGTAPVLDPPIGLCPELAVLLVGNGRVAGHAFRVRARLGIWQAGDLRRDAPGGQLIKDAELRWLDIRVNELDLATASTYAFSERMSDESGVFFPEPVQTGWFQGFPVYSERIVIARDTTQPLLRPVRLDRALRWFIADRTRQLAETTGADKTSTDMRHRFTREQADAQVRLKTLTPDEAAAPACLTAPAASLALFDGVARVGTPGCRVALVEDNPALFDRRVSRAAAQVVTVGTAGVLAAGRPSAARPTSPQKLWALGHLLYGLDWRRLRQELMPPP
jgi:hypothetical protein